MSERTKLTLAELSKRIDWKEAVVVFTADSFVKEYSEESRSYLISRDARYFDTKANSTSLFGECLDGTDPSVRLDYCMDSGWKVDHCYIIN